jgi:hypothetical protein
VVNISVIVTELRIVKALGIKLSRENPHHAQCDAVHEENDGIPWEGEPNGAIGQLEWDETEDNACDDGEAAEDEFIVLGEKVSLVAATVEINKALTTLPRTLASIQKLYSGMYKLIVMIPLAAWRLRRAALMAITVLWPRVAFFHDIFEVDALLVRCANGERLSD